jgi:hypothetical protein
VTLSDFISSSFVSDFKSLWEELGDSHEVKDVFNLSAMPNLQTAVKHMVDYLGIDVHPTADLESSSDKTSHILLGSGIFIDGTQVLIRGRFVYEPQSGVTMELAVRSSNHFVNDVIVNSIG